MLRMIFSYHLPIDFISYYNFFVFNNFIEITINMSINFTSINNKLNKFYIDRQIIIEYRYVSDLVKIAITLWNLHSIYFILNT